MWIAHSSDLWRDFPHLVAGVLVVEGVSRPVDVAAAVAPFHRRAAERLAGRVESELPEIQAWRRAYAQLGLKPTQYRSAAEALLRRFRREGELPSINPLVDVGNAVSVAYAIPVAVFDASRVAEQLEIRYATGAESYETFGGEVETPAPGEVIFADAEGRAHARRWTNRQSGRSAARAETDHALFVSEALHDTAAADVPRLFIELADLISTLWPEAKLQTAVLTADRPRFDL